MKDTFYFSHDYNARTDVKIKRLIAKTGYRGYGVFWAIVEDLYNNANALPLDYESIAFDLREDAEFVKSIICNFDLFVFDNDIFGSASVERRLSERNEKSENARKSALKRWGKMPTHSEINANALPAQSDGNAIKERKGKEIKEKKERFTPPQLYEVIEYFAENGYSEQAATKAFNYYNVAEWKDSNGKQVKNWKQKMQMVWFKDEHKDKSKAKEDGTDPNYISPTGLKGTFEIEQRGNITIRNYHGLHQYEYSSDGGKTWNKRDKP